MSAETNCAVTKPVTLTHKVLRNLYVKEENKHILPSSLLWCE